MAISLQRLGDNPKDHDGSFTGFNPTSAADVNGLRPDADSQLAQTPMLNAKGSKSSPFEPWVINPPPPPAHWHWQADSGEIGAGGEGFETSERQSNGQIKPVLDNELGTQAKVDARGTTGNAGFDFETCVIPGKDESSCLKWMIQRSIRFTTNPVASWLRSCVLFTVSLIDE
jgi:AMP deaminase